MRAIGFIIAFVCFIGVVRGYATNGTCGKDGVSWFLDNNATIHVYGNGTIPDMCPCDVDRDLRSKIRHLVVEEGVTEIGECDFEHWFIESAIIASSVKRIKWHAFYSCKNLRRVEYLGNSDPGDFRPYTFDDCPLNFVCVPDTYESKKFCGIYILKPFSACAL